MNSPSHLKTQNLVPPILKNLSLSPRIRNLVFESEPESPGLSIKTQNVTPRALTSRYSVDVQSETSTPIDKITRQKKKLLKISTTNTGSKTQTSTPKGSEYFNTQSCTPHALDFSSSAYLCQLNQQSKVSPSRFSSFRQGKTERTASASNLFKVSSPRKDLFSYELTKEREDLSPTKKKLRLPSVAEEAEKFIQIVQDCKTLNREVLKIGKALKKKETKLESEITQLQQPVIKQFTTKDFWRNNKDFIEQRARMQAEIKKYRRNLCEAEEERLIKREAQQLEEKNLNSEKKEQEENKEDEIKQILLKTSRRQKKKSFQKSRRVTSTNIEMAVTERNSPIPGETESFHDYFGKLAAQRMIESIAKKSKNKRIVLKKFDKLEQIDLMDIEYDAETETPTMRKAKKLAPVSPREFDRNLLLESSDTVLNADIKRRQKAFLNQFRKEKKQDFMTNFALYKKTNLTQRKNIPLTPR